MGGGVTGLVGNPARQGGAVLALGGVGKENAHMEDTRTGLENLTCCGARCGLDAKASKSRAQALLEALDLTHAAGQKLGAYSTGMRQRLSLARALMHRPQVLFLDEPTSGLDPQSAQAVHALPRRLARAEGTTCFLCTHQLRYAQEICTCYGLMDQGRLFAHGTLDPLRAHVGGGGTLLLQAGGPPLPFPQTGPGRYEIPLAGDADLPALVPPAAAAGGELTRVPPPAPTLEDLYFHLIRPRQEAFP